MRAGPPPAALALEALTNLRGQGARSLLALLGIVIGAAAIVALTNLGHVAQAETLKRFEQMGVDMLVLRGIPAGEGPVRLDRETIERLPASDPDVVEATPLAIGRDGVRPLNRRQVAEEDAMIVAVTPAIFQVAGLDVARGRALGPFDACVPVAVAGSVVARDLTAGQAVLEPGERLSLAGYVFTLVGVLEPAPLEALSPVDYDRSILIPLSCARRALAAGDPTVALVRLQPEADPDRSGPRLAAALGNATATVTVRSAREMIVAMKRQTGLIARLLAGIGGISLVVGGIGVLNVMLMSVMERRREIGLRAALGATPADIRTLFAIEAAILSLGGGMLGAALGMSVTVLFSLLSGWDYVAAWWIPVLGPAVAVLVGGAFGFYPAFAAARVDPIEALRAE